MRLRCLSIISLGAGLALGSLSASAQDTTGSIGDADFLQGFGGNFSGSGKLKRAADSSPRSLTCTFQGSGGGTRISLNGECSASILSTSVNIETRFDKASGRYVGSYRDGVGTVATLSGTRRGGTLVLAFSETAESVNPGPPGRLTIAQSEGGLRMSLRSSQPDAGQNLDLALQKQ
jgi:hypothetical protein